MRAQGLQNVRLASRVGAKMKRYGLDVIGSENFETGIEQTTAYVNVE